MIDIMTRTQIQLPDPLYQRLKTIAKRQDWSLAEVVRKAAEHFVSRFPENDLQRSEWQFPVIEAGGDFVNEPASVRPEVDAIAHRARK